MFKYYKLLTRDDPKEEEKTPTNKVNAKDNTSLEERMYSNSYHNWLALQTDETVGYFAEVLGPKNFLKVGKAFSVMPIPGSNDELQKYIASIAQVSVPLLYTLMDISTMDSAGITQMQFHPFVPLTGRGVLVGIIDTGIDYTNEVFINPDGKTKIVNIWDQSKPGKTNEEKFVPYGTEYTREQINEALKAEDPYSVVEQKDENGHGTFIAGLAAGNRTGNFTGAAIDAELIVVKLKEAKPYLLNHYMISKGDVPIYQEDDIMLAVDYIHKLAIKLQRPVSICISLGTSLGSHDSFGHLTNFCSEIGAYRGRTVCVAAGNEGNSEHHASGQLESKGDIANVELRVASGESGFSVNIWVSAPDLITVSLSSPTGEIIEKVPFSISGEQSYDLVLEKTVVTIEYTKYSSLNGDQHIIIKFDQPTAGIWVITLYGERVVNGEYNLWLPQTGLIEKNTYFLTATPFKTITDPGNNPKLIVAGAYNFVNESIFIEGSRGYSRTNQLTPTIVAPGVDVTGPVPGGGFESKSGTSIAAAICAGACALILEWGILLKRNEDMNTITARTMLISGAIRQPGILYPNRQSGYGQLSLINSFKELQTASFVIAK